MEYNSEMAASSHNQLLNPASDRFGGQIEQYFELSLFAMVVTGFVTLAGTGRLDAISILSVLCALGLRAFLFITRRKVTLSVALTSQLTIVYFVFFAVDLFLISGNYIAPVVHMVLFILIVKLFSVQSERDHIYLAIISFLMILAAAVLTVDSFFLAAFCLFMLLTVTTSISMEMRRSLRAAMANEPARVKIETKVAGRKLVASLSMASALLVAGIAAGAAGIFFILPRVSSNYLNRFASQSSFAAGFSDEVTLGEIGRIQQLDVVVMHVEFSPGVEPPHDMKWRGIALNEFDGRRWKNTTNGWTIRSGPDNQLNMQTPMMRGLITGASDSNPASSGEIIRYRVAMQPIGANVIFVLPFAVSVDVGPRDFAIDASGDISLLDPTRQARIYTARSRLQEPTPQQKNASGEYPQSVMDDYLQVPDDLDPRIGKLAAEAAKGSASPYEKAAAIEKYLKRNFGYTLTMVAPPNNGDPLAFFLFTRKKGHCEYFSSAMAIMLRTLGIPSRVVNGFRGGEYNDVSGKYIVRAKDAHSWVEAYIPGFGWATFDPTPADPTGQASPWTRLGLYMDAMRDFWNDWVVNYDFSHQESLSSASIVSSRRVFASLQRWFRDKYRLALNSVRRVQTSVRNSPERMAWSVISSAIGLLLLLNARRMAQFVKKGWLARQPSKAPRAAASIWYERMTGLLRRRGMEKMNSQTAQEFIEQISPPQLRDRVSVFTDHYEKARFGGSQEDAVRLPGLYEEIEEVAKR